MQQTCKNSWCGQAFEITDEDLKFYEKISPEFAGKKYPIPPPTLCPECREQRRLAHVNRSHLYRRTSDFSGKEIISIFSPEKKLKVYENEIWWSDQWDPLTYGHTADGTKPILPQIGKLFTEVPVMALFNEANENSPYVNTTGWAKNCYLCYGADYSEDCYYGEAVYHCRNTLDSHSCQRCEQCYECIDCNDCFSVLYGQNCNQCNDCFLIDNCIGCHDCFGCSGLRHKEYCYFNEECSAKDYQAKVNSHLPLTHLAIADAKAKWQVLKLQQPHKFCIGVKNENVSGNYLWQSKNAYLCFDSDDLEDCKYCTNMRTAKDCHDTNYWGHSGELLYENMAVGEGAIQVHFSNCVWGGTENMLYCAYCIGSKNCFGCSGLRHKQYCMLNKQYSKDDYERNVSLLIEQMRKTGEWGEFPPASLSVFAYGESLAQEFFPLTREEVLRRSWQWSDYEPPVLQVEKIIHPKDLPPSIDDIPDDILNWAIECEATKKPFKIIKQELDFYRNRRLPIPHFHPDERHRRRMALRNPRKLWNRTCASCQKPIATSYSSERPEIVYCEECYLKTMY